MEKNSEVKDFWNFDKTELSDSNQDYFEALKVIIFNKENKAKVFEYLRGEKETSNKSGTTVDWRYVVDAIRGMDHKNREDFVNTYNIMTYLVRKGNELKIWNFKDDPGFVISLKREFPFCNPETMFLSSELDAWKDCFMELPSCEYLTALIGDIIFYAISYLGINTYAGLQAFLCKIKDGKIYGSNRTVWVTSQLSYRGMTDQERRRILLEPMTLSVIQRLFDTLESGSQANKLKELLTKAAAKKQQIKKCFRDSFKARRYQNMIPSLSKVMDAQKVLMEECGPAILMHYSVRSSVVNHSLSEICWCAIQGVEHIGQKEEDKDFKLSTNPNYENNTDESVLDGIYLKNYESLKKVFDGCGTREDLIISIGDWLDNFDGGKYSIFYLLAKWLQELLNRNTGRGSGAKVSTLRSMFYAISLPLVEYVGVGSTRKVTVEDWTEIFISILENYDNKCVFW